MVWTPWSTASRASSAVATPFWWRQTRYLLDGVESIPGEPGAILVAGAAPAGGASGPSSDARGGRSAGVDGKAQCRIARLLDADQEILDPVQISFTSS